MAKQGSETQTLMLMVLMALWLAAFGYSVVYLLTTDPTGDGFSRGLNRISGFFGWQGVAGILAFACWGIGWSYPKGSGIRRASGVPIATALALVLVLIGMAIFGAAG